MEASDAEIEDEIIPPSKVYISLIGHLFSLESSTYCPPHANKLLVY